MRISLGDTYTTKASKVTGTVQEIIEKPNGRVVLLLDVNGEDRYTTV